MNIVTVNASKSYDVVIKSGLLTELGTYAANLIHPGKAFIVSDTNVWPLYGKQAEESLTKQGFSVDSFIIPAGEQSKNGQTYLEILNRLAECRLTRADLLIALGGGVVGDITGLAAATYLRGVAYIQIPTTLLAMVDSSVGGKTAIDLPAGKNLAGAFYQPSLVLCDISVLDTLPTEIFRDGCAEVIKYAILYDPELFAHLSENRLNFDRQLVICRCVSLKRDVVVSDEFDRSGRQRLNLGHTLGHGVEAGSNYTISHGRAVAIGMAIISRAAAAKNICSAETKDKIINILHCFDLPVETDDTAQQLLGFALSDKKRNGDFVNLIIPEQIGYCRIEITPVDHLLSYIEAGL